MARLDDGLRNGYASKGYLPPFCGRFGARSTCRNVFWIDFGHYSREERQVLRAYQIGATPPGEVGYQSILSLLTAAVVGRGWFYYLTISSVLGVGHFSEHGVCGLPEALPRHRSGRLSAAHLRASRPAAGLLDRYCGPGRIVRRAADRL